ncbi:MAG: leucyl aminopeptidase, partial [Candidatus Omnitrophota bacterium]
MPKIQFDPKIKFLKKPSIFFLTKKQVASLKSLALDKLLSDQIATLVASKRFSAEEGETFPLLIKQVPALIVGLGNDKEISKTSLRVAVKQALASPYIRGLESVSIFPHAQDDETIFGIIEGATLGIYKWQKYIALKKDKKVLSSVTIAAPSKGLYLDQVKICGGVNYARDFVNDNSNVVHSLLFEKEIKRLVKGRKNIHLDILTEKDLKKKGLNLILAVNRASQYPPRLMIIRYQGLKKSSDYTAIVGKGITFDTGGLNLKPTGSIETMRSDMAGAAAVLGVLKNAISLGVKKNILFVVAIAENAIGKSAQKPGDVVKSYDGKTVEIANTDAEGRLVLADAMAYVVKNYKPSRMIDIATLTGACAVALGHDHSGLMSNDDKLAETLLKMGQITDDRLWRLPLYAELKTYVKSQYADLKNSGLPRGIGGTMSAAEFLRQFVGDTKWAHLDIAGTAFAEAQGR